VTRSKGQQPVQGNVTGANQQIFLVIFLCKYS
jgi:hypothetical protein